MRADEDHGVFYNSVGAVFVPPAKLIEPRYSRGNCTEHTDGARGMDMHLTQVSVEIPSLIPQILPR